MNYSITILKDVNKTENPKCVTGKKYDLPFDRIKKAVVNYAWAPSIFKDNYRSKANFLYSDLMALDFDENSTLSDVARRLKNLNLDYAISLTRHHQIPKPQKSAEPKPPCDRFRVIVPLEERIVTIEDFESTWAMLYEHFPEVDSHCKDPSRLFFASINGQWEG